MGIQLTADERKQLRSGGSSVSVLPGSEREVSTYHDPKTGQEFENLPVDPYSFEHYTRIRHLRVGSAPAELRAKWEAGEAERLATYEQRLENHRRKQEQINQDNDIFGTRDDVIAGLQQQIEELKQHLGLAKPDEVEEEEQASPRQLELL
jgi:hypothetical protein